MLVKTENYASVVIAVHTPEGQFESVLLQPRKGWVNTHLFGGIGVFPYWRSAASCETV